MAVAALVAYPGEAVDDGGGVPAEHVAFVVVVQEAVDGAHANSLPPKVGGVGIGVPAEPDKIDASATVDHRKLLPDGSQSSAGGGVGDVVEAVEGGVGFFVGEVEAWHAVVGPAADHFE